MVAISQVTTVQPGGVIHIHSDQLTPGTTARVTVVVESPESALSLKETPESGFLAGRMWISDDFDAPLPDSFWLGDQ